MVNSILSDYTIDRRFIYDVSKVVKRYKDNNKRADVSFIREISGIFAGYNDVSLNYVGAIPGYFKDAGGYYECFNELYVNFDCLFSEAKDIQKGIIGGHSFNAGDNAKFYNFVVFVTIIHELSHAKQDYIIKNNKGLNADVYRFCSNLVEDNIEFYNLYHDLFPFERYANLYSLKIASEVFDYVYKNRNNLVFNLDYLYMLIQDYIDSVDGPLYRFQSLCELFKCEDFGFLFSRVDNSNLQLYDRLFLGLPISDEEYLKVKNIYHQGLDCFYEDNLDNREYRVKSLCKRINGK